MGCFDVQRIFQIGELYKLKKKKHGGTGANQYKVQSPQNEDSAKTADIITRRTKHKQGNG